MPNEPMKSKRKKDVREHLQEAVNANTVKIAERGVEGIDKMKERSKRALEKRGIAGCDDILDTGADFLKALLIRGISK